MAATNRIGVCAWCLQTDDPVTAFRRAREELDVDLVQIGFFGSAAVEAADFRRIRAAAEANNIDVSASFVLFDNEDYSSIAAVAATGGFAADDRVDERMNLLRHVCEITAALNVERISIHAGTIPGDATQPRWTTLRDRFRAAADLLADYGPRLLFETGQEPGTLLADMLEAIDRPNIGVNFDSGNFIMYGTDEPAGAAALLAPRIEHVHLKDAHSASAPGQAWGQEVTLGEGHADIRAVVTTLFENEYTGPLLIERSRRRSLKEVRASIDYLRRLLPTIPPPSAD